MRWVFYPLWGLVVSALWLASPYGIVSLTNRLATRPDRIADGVYRQVLGDAFARNRGRYPFLVLPGIGFGLWSAAHNNPAGALGLTAAFVLFALWRLVKTYGQARRLVLRRRRETDGAPSGT